MNALEIVVPGVVITIVTVGLGFIFNQVLVYLGNRFNFTVTRRVKIGSVYAVAVGLTGFYAQQVGWVLPDPAVDPGQFVASLLAFATLVTKAAQPIYTLIGRDVLTAAQ